MPTKTPGLLTLSKPVQQPQNRNRSSPKPKQKSPQPGHAVAVPVPQPAAPFVDTQSAKVSQSPEKRGRQAPTANIKAKQTPRSVSSRRPRQQTPPATVPSQAEESAPLKPFFDSFSPANAPTPALKLSKPSGKLAHRRQTSLFSDPTATRSKSMPVPTAVTNKKPFSHKRASAPPDFAFPICDDISELGDRTDVDDMSPPTTPTRSRRQHTYTYGFEDGPKTAPLSSSTGSIASFQFSQPVSLRGSPANGKKAGRARRHVRSPSEGVFHMSDEERDSLPSLSSSSGNSSLSSLNSTPSEEVRALFGLGSFGSFGKKQRAMFASSTFLNSPDPEELPPPSF